MLKRLAICTVFICILLSMLNASSASADAGPPANEKSQAVQVAQPNPAMVSPALPITASLVLAVIVEGIIVMGFAWLRRKPVGRLLGVSVLANILTQAGLWLAILVLSLYYYDISTWLTFIEIGIWLFDAAFLKLFPRTELSWKEALPLSLVMNAASFFVGMGSFNLISSA